MKKIRRVITSDVTLEEEISDGSNGVLDSFSDGFYDTLAIQKSIGLVIVILAAIILIIIF